MSYLNEIIVVSGLGRCGSSLTMQMLNAAGVECTGKHPAYEDQRCGVINQKPKWLIKQQGKACKILLPYAFKFKPANYKFIWVDREPIHQASSTLKFKHLLISPETDPKNTAKTIKTMALAYHKDRKRAFKQMEKFGPVLEITFEDLIIYPQNTAGIIAGYLNLNQTMSELMAKIVIPRSTAARLDMDIEYQLSRLKR